MTNEFEDELPHPLPDRLAPMLVKNRAIEAIFAKYDLSEEFEASPEYEQL